MGFLGGLIGAGVNTAMELAKPAIETGLNAAGDLFKGGLENIGTGDKVQENNNNGNNNGALELGGENPIVDLLKDLVEELTDDKPMPQPQQSAPALPDSASPQPASVLPQSAAPALPQSAASVLPQSAAPALPQSAASVLPQSAAPALPQSGEPSMSMPPALIEAVVDALANILDVGVDKPEVPTAGNPEVPTAGNNSRDVDSPINIFTDQVRI